MNKTTKIYKLTNQDMTTHNGFQWKLGKWVETSGEGNLCGNGWFHCYLNKEMAVLMNPIHANIFNPRLFVGEGKGKRLNDGYLKSGFTKMRLVREIKLPEWDITQKVAFAILCSIKVYKDKSYQKWAKDWLSGKDRTAASAASASAAASAASASAAAYAASAAYASDAAYASAYVANKVASISPLNFKQIIKKAKEMRASLWSVPPPTASSNTSLLEPQRLKIRTKKEVLLSLIVSIVVGVILIVSIVGSVIVVLLVSDYVGSHYGPVENSCYERNIVR